MNGLLAPLVLVLLLLGPGLRIADAQGGLPPFAPLPPPPVPAENPQTPAKIALGTALFCDEQLSKTGTVACGTCHMPRARGSGPRTRTPNAASVHPGPDALFNTADDIVGSISVPRHDGNGLYLFDSSFGMAPQVGRRRRRSTRPIRNSCSGTVVPARCSSIPILSSRRSASAACWRTRRSVPSSTASR